MFSRFRNQLTGCIRAVSRRIFQFLSDRVEEEGLRYALMVVNDFQRSFRERRKNRVEKEATMSERWNEGG